MTYKETEILISKYLNGETSIEEEKRLALEVMRDDRYSAMGLRYFVSATCFGCLFDIELLSATNDSSQFPVFLVWVLHLFPRALARVSVSVTLAVISEI